MIRRRSQAAPAVPAGPMMAALQGHLNQLKSWLKDKANISVLDVHHHDLLGDPKRVCTSVKEFLSADLGIDAMVSQLDPTLYRQRVATSEK
jgi:hypothetical protein